MIWRPRKMWQTQQLPVLQHIVSQDDPTSMICGHPRPKAQGHPQFRSNIQLLAQVHSSHSWTCTPIDLLGSASFPPKMLGCCTQKSWIFPLFFWGFSLPKCWVCPLKNPLCRVSGRVLMSSQVCGASWQKISYQWWYRTILPGRCHDVADQRVDVVRPEAAMVKNLLVLSREWMGMGVAGMIITSDYGPFPHSLLSTSKKICGQQTRGIWWSGLKVSHPPGVARCSREGSSCISWPNRSSLVASKRRTLASFSGGSSHCGL